MPEALRGEAQAIDDLRLALIQLRLRPAFKLSALPEVDYPTIQVVTLYPGASPDVITSSITAPLERQFGQMPGLKQMSSISSGGASVITLQFDLSLSLGEMDGVIAGGLEYATALFEPSTIERYLGYWRHLLEGMVADDSQAVDRLPYRAGAS